jgi:5,5'-dehydrodivanillate O-demethylase oxygenase subunit
MRMQERSEDEGSIDAAVLAHTGPGTLAGRYLRRFWMPVARLEDVAAGRARTIQVLGEKFTYFRGTTGDPHLVAAECAHRGTLLSTGHVEENCIRCFYHGWKYDGDGQCIDQPAEQDGFASKVSIAGFPTREYCGLVFAYLGEGKPPVFQRLASFERPGYVVAASIPRHTNFYNQLENSVDHIHFNFVHRRSAFGDMGINREFPTIFGEETEYGIFKDHRYSDGRRRIGHLLMPTTLYTLVVEDDQGWNDHLSWRIPVDDDRHITFTIDLIEKAGAELERYHAIQEKRRERLRNFEPADQLVRKILNGDLHVDDVPREHPQLLLIQDDVALAAQRPLFARASDRLGRSDTHVILLRKIWLRELRALAMGAPLKSWEWPTELSLTSGA